MTTSKPRRSAYDQKVVLLWDKRLKVPSNLQGLYRSEFEGGQLTFAAGTKLAKAVKGFRSWAASNLIVGARNPATETSHGV